MGLFKHVFSLLSLLGNGFFLALSFAAASLGAYYFFFSAEESSFLAKFFASIGSGFVVFMFLKALSLLMLALVDFALLLSPNKLILSYGMEKARARLVRVLSKKSVSFSEIDEGALSLFEQSILKSLSSFKTYSPQITLCKNPLVVVRLQQTTLQKTSASFLVDENTDSRVLAKKIENELKLPAHY